MLLFKDEADPQVLNAAITDLWHTAFHQFAAAEAREPDFLAPVGLPKGIHSMIIHTDRPQWRLAFALVPNRRMPVQVTPKDLQHWHGIVCQHQP